MNCSTYRLLSSACVAVLSFAGIGAAATPTLDSEQWAFLSLINNFRSQNGAGPLQVSVALQNSSQWMSTDMATKNYFSHTDSLGRDPFTRIVAFGYPYSPAGENIAAGNLDAQNTFTQWQTACDPDGNGTCTYAHRQNMLNPSFKVIGIGRANNPAATYRWYWTTDFGGVVDQTISPTGNAAPTADSVTPNTGSGSSQNFAFKYSSANGYQTLTAVYALINGGLSAVAGCVPVYVPTTNSLYLYNDAGTILLGPVTPGSAGSLSNSQCTINVSGSSAIGSGNTLTLTLPLVFNAAFKGTQTLFGYAADKSNLNSGWQTLGTWTSNTLVATPPTADSVTPSSGTGASQNFTFKYSSVNGYQYINTAYALINGVVNGAGGCFVYYMASNNSLYLYNDAGYSLTGPLIPGSAATLSNSQCTINGAGSSVTGAGNTLSLTLAVTFSSTFKGLQTLNGYATDRGGLNSGWKTLGTWTAASTGVITAPTADSVTPSSGSGASQTFTFKFSSSGGYLNIGTAWALINGSLSVTNGCVAAYVAPNALYLLNDAGNAWIGPTTPGIGANLSNTQCTINGVGSSITGAGNTLSMKLAVTFNPAFRGTQTLFGYAADATLNSGWKTLGTWTAF